MKRYPYEDRRKFTNGGKIEPLTDRQLAYIQKLAGWKHDELQTLSDILDSIDPFITVDRLTKGQGIFVIKCLKGEIMPVDDGVDALKKENAELRAKLEEAEIEFQNIGARSFAQVLLQDDGVGQMADGPCNDALQMIRKLKAQNELLGGIFQRKAEELP